MHISLAASHANGFNKWCAAHDAGRKHDGRPVAADLAVMVDQDLDSAVTAPPERPHRPWLVPGAGTL